MQYNIDHDRRRFQEILKGRVRRDFRQYINHGEMIGRQGRDLVSIPVPQIETPRFRYGARAQGGTGQGEGEPGTPLGPPEGEDDGRAAGDQPGEHVLEVEVTLEELARMLAEELELPRIEPKGKRNILSPKPRYTTVRPVGPDSLRHFRRSYRQALRRQLASGTYDPQRPVVVPIREDMRYRSWQEIPQPECNAVIILMMDVSGSMGDEQKELVRVTTFWIDTWLRTQYDGLETRYLVHDAAAHEVDEHTFYHTRESGGTKISSAYALCLDLIEREYPPEEWNIYPFHFSDGDNWSEDNADCLRLLQEELLPRSNLFCYGQVASYYGSGEFLNDLKDGLGSPEKLAVAEIDDRDDIYDAIKAFLGRGR